MKTRDGAEIRKCSSPRRKGVFGVLGVFGWRIYREEIEKIVKPGSAYQKA